MKYQNLVKNLKKYRELRRLSQKELAKTSGVNYVTLTKIENQTIRNPSLPIVSKLAEALGVGVEDIFYGVNDRKRSAPSTLVNYQEMLAQASNGKSDVLGYSYMAAKINQDTRKAIDRYRKKLVQSGRKDKFVVPATTDNIKLIAEESRAEDFQKIFSIKYIDPQIFSEKMDIYVWDQYVGICLFEEVDYQVKLYNCPLIHSILKSYCELLWSLGKTKP